MIAIDGHPQDAPEEFGMDQLQQYSENVCRFPLTDTQLQEHAGEYVARSLDGTLVLAFASSLSDLETALRRDYGKSLSEVVIGVVESPFDLY